MHTNRVIAEHRNKFRSIYVAGSFWSNYNRYVFRLQLWPQMLLSYAERVPSMYYDITHYVAMHMQQNDARHWRYAQTNQKPLEQKGIINISNCLLHHS